MRALRENRLTLIGLALLAGFVALALFGPWLAPHDPLASDVARKLEAPSLAHPFGTDHIGRDVLSRVLVAARLDLAIALGAVALAFVAGSAAGALAGFFGGWTDRVVSRVVDTIMAFPFFVLAMGIVAALGNTVGNIVLATAIINFPAYARMARAEANVRREAGWVEAARLAGNRPLAILGLHVFPNCIGPLAVLASMNLGWAILNVAGLSFIGLGVRPPTPEWGIMVADGAAYIVSGEWWVALFPGLALALAVFGFNLLGDGLRDALDPRTRSAVRAAAQRGLATGAAPAAAAADAPILAVENLSVHFRTFEGTVQALEAVSFAVAPGETVAIVGESGSGKSTAALAILGLLPPAAQVIGGRVLLDPGSGAVDLLALGEEQRSRYRGAAAAMIFQGARTALNPIRPVGRQIEDVLVRHAGLGRAAAHARAVELLAQVQIADPARRANAYPFELSGGMCQRVMIAIAVACEPALLIADEPTSGLDVTTQVAILELIRELAARRRMATLLITHDLALAGERADRIVVMHAGHVVEVAPTADLFRAPRHPYTARLMASTPRPDRALETVLPIPGAVPDLRAALPVCRFSMRCERRIPACDEPPLPRTALEHGRVVACRVPLT